MKVFKGKNNKQNVFLQQFETSNQLYIPILTPKNDSKMNRSIQMLPWEPGV